MPKVSIIVPVYCVEKSLDRCIESILNQTYSDWELLLIDDGSPDRSGVLCDAWAECDSRIRVFHKENGGVSSARNYGIDQSKGEWITFIDADDSISLETLEKCVDYFESADIVRFSMKYIYSDDGQQFKCFILPKLSHDDYIYRIVARETILGVCGGIYKRTMFIENNIRFDESLINGEDWVVLLHLVLIAKDIAILQDTFYLYDKTNEVSCTNTINFEKSISTLRALHMIIGQIDNAHKKGYEKAIAKAKCTLGYVFYAGVLSRLFSVSKEELDKYSSLIGITKRDISIGTSSLKERVLLRFFSNRLGLFFLKCQVSI